MGTKDLIKSRNCLNTVRLLAALQVMLTHLSNYLPQPAFMVPVRRVLSLFPGVPIFFILSGYLIWHSIETSGSYGQYLKRRFLRIYPELWGSVLLEILCLVLLYDRPVPLTDLAAFAFGQATVFQFWKPASVTGYGCGTPNGALWTIPVLVCFYVLVWWLRAPLHGKKKLRWLCWLGASLLVSVLIRMSEPILPQVVYSLLRYSLIPHFWLFLLGMAAAEYCSRLLPLVKRYWLLLLLLAAVLTELSLRFSFGYYDFANSLLLFLGWLGFAYRYPRFNISPDLSYGIYIYHMLPVNALLALYGPDRPWTYPVAIVLTLVLAWGSERLFLPLIRKLRKNLLKNTENSCVS